MGAIRSKQGSNLKLDTSANREEKSKTSDDVCDDIFAQVSPRAKNSTLEYDEFTYLARTEL